MVSIWSARSVPIEARAKDRVLGCGTGFIVCRDQKQFLVTNYHVAAGRNPRTGQPEHSSAAVPDVLRLEIPQDHGDSITWQTVDVAVLSKDKDERESALWFEHPTLGRQVDVVALALPPDAMVTARLCYDPWNAGPMLRVVPGTDVKIIGFPFGLRASAYGSALGIWTHGFVASEPEIDIDGEPRFYVDARTRKGQSGSPVVAYSDGRISVFTNGSIAGTGREVANLLGVYSGRVNEESDLGIVWKISALQEVIDGRAPGRAGL